LQSGCGSQVLRRHCQPGTSSSSVPFQAGPAQAAAAGTIRERGDEETQEWTRAVVLTPDAEDER